MPFTLGTHFLKLKDLIQTNPPPQKSVPLSLTSVMLMGRTQTTQGLHLT